MWGTAVRLCAIVALGAAGLVFFPARAVSQSPADLERLTRQALDALRGTTSVEFTPSFADGKLSACAIEFNVIAQDWAYKQGQFIKIGGSFGLMSAKGIVATYLKVLLHDVDMRTMTFSPSAPASAYFIAGTTDLADILDQ